MSGDTPTTLRSIRGRAVRFQMLRPGCDSPIRLAAYDWRTGVGLRHEPLAFAASALFRRKARARTVPSPGGRLALALPFVDPARHWLGGAVPLASAAGVRRMGCGDGCLLNDEGYRAIEGSSRPPLINLTANPRALSSRNIAKKLASACRRAGSLSEAPEGRGRRHTGGGAPV